MAASAPKTLRNLGGDVVTTGETSYLGAARPLDPKSLAQTILQLQNTVNELISKFNAHQHIENTAGAYAQNATTTAPTAGSLVTGAGAAATNLFTAS